MDLVDELLGRRAPLSICQRFKRGVRKCSYSKRFFSEKRALGLARTHFKGRKFKPSHTRGCWSWVRS